MKYDDASWHYGGDFPKDSPKEFGATHIGLLLKWCFKKGWAGDLHTEEEPSAVQAVIDDKETGTSFLLKYCDEKLTNEDFNEEGNAFLLWYYERYYVSDYAETFEDQMYLSPESEHDYKKFAGMAEKRYQQFLKGSTEELPSSAGDTKPWWKFW